MLVCAACGEENPDRARFCGACGSRLAEGPIRRPEERRIVTALFCEILGIPRESRGDPEELRAVLGPVQLRIRSIVEGFGGTVDKFVGPVTFAVFGAPVGHEDDPERAVRAALRIREAVEDLRDEGEVPLAARSGVNTGEVMVTLAPGPQVGERIVGDAVNTASRLQEAAAPGQVLVGPSTHEVTQRLFEYRPLEALRVKGKAEPVPVWEPIEATSRLGVEAHQRSSTPFVGRDEERAILEGAFRRAMRQPSVQLVTITGEPGVGKSRLIDELSSLVDATPELVRWREGRCLPYGEGISFSALAEIVKAEAGILDSDGPGEADEKLRASLELVVPDAAERDWLRGRVAPLAGIGEMPSVDRSELFAAWRRWLEALAADGPVVLVLEDLQWADTPMLEFIDHAVDWIGGLPVLVLCAARPELLERAPGWGGGKRNSTMLALAPLSDEETAQLLSALLDTAVLPVETQSELLERAGGNPLYAEEFVRMLADRGFVDGKGNVVALPLDRGVEVPSGVRAVIAARLDTLSPDRRGLLQDAAVVGKVFWAGAVAAISGLDEARVREELHEIARRELIRPTRSSTIRGQAEYGFWHVLVRDVAYGQIPHARRGAKHRAAARWLGSVAGGPSSDLAELLAHHHGEALELAPAAGVEGAELRELEADAASALTMAGDRVRRLDARRALRYFSRALALLPEEHPRRAELLLRTADARSTVGDFDGAERDFDLAVVGLLVLDDVPRLADALVRWSRTKIEHGEPAEATPLIREAIGLLEPLPPGPELATAYSRMAGDRWLAGEYAEAVAWAEKALAILSEVDVADEAVLALGYRGAARCELGDEGGLEDLRTSLRRGLERGLGEEVAVIYNNLAYELWFLQGPRASDEVWDEMDGFTRSRGFETLRWWSASGKLLTLFDLGAWDEAAALAHQMIAWDRARGGTQVGTVARAFHAWIGLWRGELDEAERALEELLPMARRIGSTEFVAPALMIAGAIARARGRPADALAHAREFVGHTREQWDLRTLYLPLAVRMLAGSGAVEEAEALIPGEEEATSTRQRLSIATARAVVLEERADLEAAAAAFAEVAEGWRTYGFELEVGQNLLGAARCLAAIGRDDEVARLAEEARDVLDGLGVRLLVAEAEGLLDRRSAAG